MSKNLNALVETALIAAVAMALSLIPDFASWFTPSFGAVPLILFALRRGSKYGLTAGLIWGLLHFALGRVYYLSLSQVFLEYIVAFTTMGIAGYFSDYFKGQLKSQQTKKALLTALGAASLTVFIRYVIHFVAGVIFWASYAGDMSPYLYSFIVNGTAGGFTLAFVLLALGILIPTQPHLFLPRK
ncbi:energy-coupled thiamine transporter ThiT [Streptococcus gallinaceus]|uniref:Thiamine transporter n=1 Tax=Streptococcus gallinaceus TaxID=165758 RepID=A0ABV2JJF8_9STRE|nr:energy-coupled thiamine transporter ThiT [Streptococcus gallinaceus]MCP1638986.1 thiamine transporter [Streptococcus gallinaceus]MCP1769770.1 thiamine transporter [Streptococcus gallinaceus]